MQRKKAKKCKERKAKKCKAESRKLVKRIISNMKKLLGMTKIFESFCLLKLETFNIKRIINIGYFWESSRLASKIIDVENRLKSKK